MVTDGSDLVAVSHSVRWFSCEVMARSLPTGRLICRRLMSDGWMPDDVTLALSGHSVTAVTQVNVVTWFV